MPAEVDFGAPMLTNVIAANVRTARFIIAGFL
jgi:hypothetical protein